LNAGTHSLSRLSIVNVEVGMDGAMLVSHADQADLMAEAMLLACIVHESNGNVQVEQVSEQPQS
jgi:hypothetical protein